MFISRFVLRVLYSVMGIIVQEKDCLKKDEKCRILIANHLTPFDHLAISLVYPCISVSLILLLFILFSNFLIPLNLGGHS